MMQRSYGGKRDNRKHGNSSRGKMKQKTFINDGYKKMSGPRLSEVQVGITEYIRQEAGFNGLIKTRYSDFHVSEIGKSGEVAKLTDMVPPTISEKEQIRCESGESKTSKYNTEILPLETWEEIESAALADTKSPKKVEIDVTGMSKDQRTKIHEIVKELFGKKIIGSTITESDKKFIIFSTYVKGERKDNRQNWKWKSEYVHFVLYKENYDTMDAVAFIADRLNMKNVKPSFFGYSGTKDRRAKTSQWISIKKVEPSKISNSMKQARGMKVGNFTFNDFNLKLGDLLGNRFKIALRNVTAPDEVVKIAVESLRDNGFINYYGLQRFGSRVDVPTYAVGKSLLQENFKEAVYLILKPYGQHASHLKTYQETGDAQLALQQLSYHSSPTIETKLLRALGKLENMKARNNYLAALDTLPRNARLLYIHSYQSLIWNKCVSERIRRFGLKCHVGDLVAMDPTIVKDLVDNTECPIIPEDEDDDDNLKNDNAKKSNDTIIDTLSKEIQSKIAVKILSEEDVAENKYTITDIIMPLPGFNIMYPPNMQDYYNELLEKDNLNLELKQKSKTYSLGGTYRYVIRKPTNLSWEFLHYSNPHDDLILSDLDEMLKRTPVKDITDGKYKSLILHFDLPSSTYATMALRELLKQDTSSEIQAQNNDYYMQSPDETVTESNEQTGEKRKTIDEDCNSGQEQESKKMKSDEQK